MLRHFDKLKILRKCSENEAIRQPLELKMLMNNANESSLVVGRMIRKIFRAILALLAALLLCRFF